MSAAPLYIFEAVDVRRADEPDSSRVLTIEKLTLSPIKRLNTSFKPGGGVGEVKLVMPQIEAPEPKFSLKGIDFDIVEKFGFSPGVFDKFVFAASVRRKGSTTPIPFRAVIQGVISEWEPDEFAVGDLLGCSHVFNEVTHYSMSFGGVEKWYWDYEERVCRSGGVDWFSGTRNALGA